MSYGLQKSTEIAFELESRSLSVSEFDCSTEDITQTRIIEGIDTKELEGDKNSEHESLRSELEREKVKKHIYGCLRRIDLRNRSYHKKLRREDYLEALEVVIRNNPEQKLLKATKLCSTLLVQATLGTFTILLDSLLEQTYTIRDEIEYWSELESDRLKAACYLLQTFPERIFYSIRDKLPSLNSLSSLPGRGSGVLTTGGEGIFNSSPKRSQSSQSHLKTFSGLFSRRFPTPLGLFLVRPPPHCFPSIRFIKTCSVRNLSSTLSPLLLIKQESRLRRRFLEESYGESVEKIGVLLSTLNELESEIKNAGGLTERSKVQFSGLISCMSLVAEVDSKEIQDPSLKDAKEEGLDRRAIQISNLLAKGLPDQKKKFNRSISQLSRPNFLSRNWPWIVASPVIIFTTAKVAFSYRQSAIDFMRDFRATLNGFVKGWVIRPIEDIIKTLRAGESSSLAIMSKDGLNSELHSLERMAIDFGREKFKWNEDELNQVAQKVREGDLTTVLKVWEQEIKNPIRSALLGSLIRVLLIQVQKVKVDLSLAMDGIQSMLRSQSLTIAAIGVAPSMLICFTIGKLSTYLLSRRTSVVGKGTRAVRMEVRLAMRRIERSLILISSNPSEDNNHPILTSHQKSPSRTIGNLFLDLNLLRRFANSSHFPRKLSNSRIKNEFLNDVQDLEDLNVSWITKRKLSKRFVKQWDFLVGV
ncbi:ATP synthase regulation protein NCA2-domain-containing protein [Phakopsora pachyrhizi]|uniref:ATP synthase regulation protein NCA2-domain-containing protein n=1 Tax=Phakopsora pachyrhizi TaxID=170000 RepID=A0AAV0AG63_PHAPC|nr:ATP synthase regulation protein NCA2-domain-containing protein [Phakopsora pachyrhizi]CAH7666942.1 ATP synthase regulation protein NCA2-domain-containing protein [Phakopsora pachyrhizi]